MRRWSGNPIIHGWYADPEIHFFEGRFWIYPTTSLPFDEQVSFEAFSSSNLVDWERHGEILNLADVPWSTFRCAWAPTVACAHGRYHLVFSAGDGAGLGLAVSDSPAGPFVDALGRPFVGEYHHGAQPIDAHLYLDEDGTAYLYWGGWGHCVCARLAGDLLSIDGEIFEITPEAYVEGPFVFKRGGAYFLMWSEGDWGDSTYRVAYGRSKSPLGPFPREAVLFAENPEVANSAGHHSILQLPGTERWVVAYHRRPLGERDPHHRVVCLEEMRFEPDGLIGRVALSDSGVAAWSLE